MGKLQVRELGIIRQKQQLLGEDRLCPGGSGGCRGVQALPWGLSQVISSITLPLAPKYAEGTGQCLHRGHLLCWEQEGLVPWEGLVQAQRGHEAHWDGPGSSHLLGEGAGVS